MLSSVVGAIATDKSKRPTFNVDSSHLAQCAAKEVFVNDEYHKGDSSKLAEILKMRNMQKLTTDNLDADILDGKVHPTLKYLRVINTKDLDLNKVLSCFTGLEHLDWGNYARHSTPQKVTFNDDGRIYPNLKILLLIHRDFKDNVSELLNALPNIEVLWLSNDTPYSVALLKKLSSMPKLKHITIGFNIFLDASLNVKIKFSANDFEALRELCNKMKNFAILFNTATKDFVAPMEHHMSMYCNVKRSKNPSGLMLRSL